MKIYGQKQPQQQASTASSKPSAGRPAASPMVQSILHLQRTIGNQAVRRLLEANSGNVKGDSTAAETAGFGHDPSQIHVGPPPAIQRKGAEGETSAISKTDGPAEHEASAVAEKVVKGETVEVRTAPSPVVHRFAESTDLADDAQRGAQRRRRHSRPEQPARQPPQPPPTPQVPFGQSYRINLRERTINFESHFPRVTVTADGALTGEHLVHLMDFTIIVEAVDITGAVRHVQTLHFPAVWADTRPPIRSTSQPIDLPGGYRRYRLRIISPGESMYNSMIGSVSVDQSR